MCAWFYRSEPINQFCIDNLFTNCKIYMRNTAFNVWFTKKNSYYDLKHSILSDKKIYKSVLDFITKSQSNRNTDITLNGNVIRYRLFGFQICHNVY